MGILEVIFVAADYHERRSVFASEKKRLGYTILVQRNARVDGSVLGKKIELESGVIIGGSVCSWGDVSIDQGCRIRGDVVSKGRVILGKDCSVQNVAAQTIHFEGAFTTVRGNVISLAPAYRVVEPIRLPRNTKVGGFVQWPRGAVLENRCELGTLLCDGDVRVKDNCSIGCIFTQGDVFLGRNVRVQALQARNLVIEQAQVDYINCTGSLEVNQELRGHLLHTGGDQYLKGAVSLRGRSLVSERGEIHFRQVTLNGTEISAEHQFWTTQRGGLVTECPAQGGRGTLLSHLLDHTLWETIEEHVTALRGRSPWLGWGE